MAEFPAMPLWTDAYLADTRHLSAAEHGAYLLLMMEAWRRPNCSLPDDDALLSRLACMSHNEWGAARDTVLSFFTHDGKTKTWKQKRLSKEHEYLQEKRKKNRVAAAKRWKETEKDVANGYANAMPKASQPTPTPTPLKKDPSDQKKGTRIPEDFQPDLDTAVDLGLRPERAISEAASFKDFWKGKAGKDAVKLDWPATWRNWVRKAVERQNGPRGSPAQSRYQEGADRVRADLERSARGEEHGNRRSNNQSTFDLDATDFRRS